MLRKHFTQTIITVLCLKWAFNNCKIVKASEPYHVYCNKDFISVQFPLTTDRNQQFVKEVYWQNSSSNALKGCQPFYSNREISLMVKFKDFFKCGFSRSFQKWKVSYYQDLILKQFGNTTQKIKVKCSYQLKKDIFNSKHKLNKRSSLPESFQEDDDFEVLGTVEQRAPEPKVIMEVRQNNELIDGMVTVIPGTPLVMEIKLNDLANGIYGLNVNYLEVTNMADMKETILFRGCTVDSYLFENFNASANNSLTSKFRAFKFPNTAFVQFRANVQICLNKCMTVQCSGNNASEAIRQRRDISPAENSFHEIHSTVVLNVNDSIPANEAEFLNLQKHVNLLRTKYLQLLNNI